MEDVSDVPMADDDAAGATDAAAATEGSTGLARLELTGGCVRNPAAAKPFEAVRVLYDLGKCVAVVAVVAGVVVGVVIGVVIIVGFVRVRIDVPVLG
jgi:hypothetical protein